MESKRLFGGIGVVVAVAAILNHVLPSPGAFYPTYASRISITGLAVGLIEGYLIGLFLSACIQGFRPLYAVLLSGAWALAESTTYHVTDTLSVRLLWTLGPLVTILVLRTGVTPPRPGFVAKALGAWLGLAILCVAAGMTISLLEYDLEPWVWESVTMAQALVVGLVGAWIVGVFAFGPAGEDVTETGDALSEFKRASRGKRMASGIIDLLLIPVILGIGVGLLFVWCEAEDIVRSVGLVIVNAVWLVIRDLGCDPGRRMVGLRLVSLSGGRPTVWQAIGRNIHLITPFVLVAAYAVEFIALLITGGRLADRWARTTVVERRMT